MPEWFYDYVDGSEGKIDRNGHAWVRNSQICEWKRVRSLPETKVGMMTKIGDVVPDTVPDPFIKEPTT